MKTIKLTTPMLGFPLQRQTPQSSLKWGDYQFYINDTIEEADYWIVGDELNKDIVSCICAPENVFLTTGESAYIKLYSRSFTRQFAKVFSFQKNLFLRSNTVKSLPMLPWFAGARQLDGMKVWDSENYLDYDYFLNDTPIKTLDKIVVVTSNKRYTKGHRRRLDFIEDLMKIFPGKIDLYGNGFTPIGDKYPIVSKYKYQLVMENCCYHSYITEKIADAFLCECYPLYVGAPDIDSYFPNNSFCKLDINDIDGAVNTIKTIFVEDSYSKNKQFIKESKNLILNKYNIFPAIVNIVESYGKPDAQKKMLQITNRHDIEWLVGMKLVKIYSLFHS